MQKLSPTYAVLAISAAVALLGIASFVFVYMRIQSARVYVAGVQDAIAQSAAKESQERILKQRAAATAPLRSQLESASVGKDEAATFIEQIEATARESGVSLDIGAVDITGENVGRLKILLLQVRTEGSLASVMKFLRLSETLPAAVVVRSVSLERRDKTWVLIATLTVPIKTSQ